MGWSHIHCLLAASGTLGFFVDLGEYDQPSAGGQPLERHKQEVDHEAAYAFIGIFSEDPSGNSSHLRCHDEIKSR